MKRTGRVFIIIAAALVLTLTIDKATIRASRF